MDELGDGGGVVDGVVVAPDVAAHGDACGAGLEGLLDLLEQLALGDLLGAAEDDDGGVDALAELGEGLLVAGVVGLDHVGAQLDTLAAGEGDVLGGAGVLCGLKAAGEGLGQDGQAPLVAVQGHAGHVGEHLVLKDGAGEAHGDDGVGAQAQGVLGVGHDLHGLGGLAQAGHAAVDAQDDALAQEVGLEFVRHADGGEEGVRTGGGDVVDQLLAVLHGGEHLKVGAVVHCQDKGLPVGLENVVHALSGLCHYDLSLSVTNAATHVTYKLHMS